MSFRYVAPGKPIGFLIAREVPACGQRRGAGLFIGGLLPGQFIALVMTCLLNSMLRTRASREEPGNG
jgi:hypothetical protein